MDQEQCDQEVFDKGTCMGVVVMSKQEADELCKKETERTGFKHDWHYFGGRVRVLALIPGKQCVSQDLMPIEK